MKNPVLYTIYENDTKLFITLFCENKDRPELKCNGKCEIAKMQNEDNEKNAANTLKRLLSEVISYNSINPIHIADNEVRFLKITEQSAYYNNLYSFLFASRMLKPPKTSPLS